MSFETSISLGSLLLLSSGVMVSNKLSDFSAGTLPLQIPAVLLVTKQESKSALLGVRAGGSERAPCPALSVPSPPKECRWREVEEHRQAERLQRQLQQEQAYLLSLQHDHRRPPPQPPQPPQDRSKPSLHAAEPKAHYEPAERAREVWLPWGWDSAVCGEVDLGAGRGGSQRPEPGPRLFLLWLVFLHGAQNASFTNLRWCKH